MADDLIPLTGGEVAAGLPIVEDRFALAFGPAKPTFDALAKLRPARNWLADGDKTDPNRNGLWLDVKHAVDWIDEADRRLNLIPSEAILKRAGRLFRDAEHLAAPEEWYPLAFGVMLAAAPNGKNVGMDYLCGLVDMLAYNEAICEGRYEPGFSVAVVAAAIREVRRTSEFVPAAATVIKACQQHRRGFRDLQWTVDTLISVRENAAEIRAEFDRQWRENFDDDDDEPIPPRPPDWKPPVDDDDDCPF